MKFNNLSKYLFTIFSTRSVYKYRSLNIYHIFKIININPLFNRRNTIIIDIFVSCIENIIINNI